MEDDMEKNVFLNEKVAKKLFKNEKYGKILSAKVISGVLNTDYETIYNNIKPSTDEIAFSSKTLNSTADAIYYDDIYYFDIELNFYQNKVKVKQLASYTYQLYLGQLPNYKNYLNLKTIIQISIDLFDYFKQGEFMYNVYFMEDRYHIKESDDIMKIHLNLAYLQNIDYTNICRSGNKLMHDLYFLSCKDDKKLGSVYEGDNLMKKVIDEAKKIAGTMELDLYLTDEELVKQNEEYNYRLGHQDGVKEGIEQGIAKTKEEMVISMYNDNVSIESISKYSNLTIEEIEKIISKDK